LAACCQIPKFVSSVAASASASAAQIGDNNSGLLRSNGGGIGRVRVARWPANDKYF
jgi:hypothetical protein